jgi:hypothetical protein
MAQYKMDLFCRETTAQLCGQPELEMAEDAAVAVAGSRPGLNLWLLPATAKCGEDKEDKVVAVRGMARHATPARLRMKLGTPPTPNTRTAKTVKDMIRCVMSQHDTRPLLKVTSEQHTRACD